MAANMACLLLALMLQQWPLINALRAACRCLAACACRTLDGSAAGAPGCSRQWGYNVSVRESLPSTLPHGLALSPLEDFVLTTSADGVLRQWDTSSGTLKRQLPPELGAGAPTRNINRCRCAAAPVCVSVMVACFQDTHEYVAAGGFVNFCSCSMAVVFLPCWTCFVLSWHASVGSVLLWCM